MPQMPKKGAFGKRCVWEKGEGICPQYEILWKTINEIGEPTSSTLLQQSTLSMQ
jgi:hypothetical protein